MRVVFLSTVVYFTVGASPPPPSSSVIIFWNMCVSAAARLDVRRHTGPEFWHFSSPPSPPLSVWLCVCMCMCIRTHIPRIPRYVYNITHTHTRSTQRDDLSRCKKHNAAHKRTGRSNRSACFWHFGVSVCVGINAQYVHTRSIIWLQTFLFHSTSHRQTVSQLRVLHN